MKSVEVVKISKFIPVYKDGIEAEKIQVVNFDFSDGSECGYNVIVGKVLYNLGDSAIYIQPDYCISDLPIFDSFIRPGGDETKCRLGKGFRIRALKFNFSLDGSSDPIYSFGILMPLSEVKTFLKDDYNEENLVDLLGVSKYEEPEKGGSGMTAGDLPSFMYATDESNIFNIKSHVKRVIESGQELGITTKVDGSSASVFFKKENDEWIYGVCSRNQLKKNEQFYIDKYVDSDGKEFHKYVKRYEDGSTDKGWLNDDTNTFYKENEIENIIGMKIIKREVKDSWIELATNSGLIEKGLEYCKKYNVELVARGEINGSGLKGSGCKNNPDAKNKQNLKLFGLDSLETGYSVRQHYGNEHNLKKFSEEIGVNYTEHVKVVKPTDFDDLIRICEDIFKDEKSKGRLIEGVVIRTLYSNDLSCKFLSAEYDSKK